MFRKSSKTEILYKNLGLDCAAWIYSDLCYRATSVDTNIFEYQRPYERISEYIRIKKMIRTNIRIYSYPKKAYERIYEYIRIKKMIRIWYERIFVSENTRIYSNIRIFVTLCTWPTYLPTWPAYLPDLPACQSYTPTYQTFYLPLPILWEQAKRLLTFETLITILIIENLKSWQS